EIGCLAQKHKYARLLSYLARDEFIALTGTAPDDLYENHATNSENYLSQATSIDFHHYLPDDILTKVDRASLANSLESRPPLLDHLLIELAFRISPRLKIKGKTTKYIFKKAMEGIVPQEIIYRKKQGFAMPLESYLRKDLRPLVYKYVFDFDKHALFDKTFLASLEQNYSLWNKDYSRLIWTLLMFNLWWEQWM
ncbi:MAG TPA: asparagine synthase C-terminal domain-containing protein, partial [Candidatus Nanoarchaeia archaeon]|nr:asparagine synthase C-terminal domain-containing protein [Candidatus Nanoarchaeia archaeon]